MARRTVEDFNGFVSARPSKKSVPVVKPKLNDKKSIPAPALKTTTTNATKPSANIRKNSYNVRPPSKVENPKRTLGQKKILSDVKNKQEEVKSSQNEIKIERKKDEVIETTTDGRTEGSTSDVSECQEYEDDFEDYESDFESDTSISLSPPTLPPTTNTVDQKISGDVSKKFSLPICVEEKLDVFLEEKFEVNSLERTIEMGLNNFKTAGKRKREQEAKNKIYTRGKMLMEMIKLDTVSYTLLDMPAIPYEQYIKMYGRSNMTQVQTQTHDDNAEKEVQTNEIDLTEKWTQHPIVLTNGLDCSSSEYQKEKSGVGGTGLDDRFNRSSRITTVDPVRVCDVGRLMLLLLEQQALDRAEKQLLPNKFDLKFSNGHLSPDVSAVKFLAKRPVMSVQFARIEAFAPSLVTMHEVMDSCCQYAICIWNVSNMKNPEYVLKCSNAVTCFCAIPKSSGGFVTAAHTDGSICLWDLGENRLHHQHIDHLQSSLRSPSFNSGLSIDQCHKSKIIGLSPVTYRNTSFTNEELPNELCSVDEDFSLTVWAVVSSWTDACEISEHKCTGTAPWSSVRLVKLQTVEACKNIPKYMSDGVTATCMCLNTNQEAFVATNSGLVFRYNLGQQKVWPAYYTYENTGEHFSINWLEICPFDSNYFLASCSDGRMMLYSTGRREALSQFFASPDASKASSIVKAQWCTGFPGVVFALDSLSRVYVWDFCDDFTTPIMSITFQRENVTSMSLMSVQENHNTYMALAFANGAVEMHQVKLSKRKKAESNDDKDYCDQLARFLASV